MAGFVYFLFLVPKMSEQQLVDSSVIIIIVVIIAVFIYGFVMKYLEDRKQKKLNHWL
jgi:fructose-specific phosphotransferase system IIC component